MVLINFFYSQEERKLTGLSEQLISERENLKTRDVGQSGDAATDRGAIRPLKHSVNQNKDPLEEKKLVSNEHVGQE